MDVSISKEFIKVYDQLLKLQNDITDVAKECYSTPVVSYDEIENTPQNLSDFDNDQNFVTEELVDDKISNISIDDSLYLKKSGEESLKCEVPTDFEVLSTRTQEEDDSSDNVATTQFVHNLVNKSSGDAVQLMIGVCASKKYVTDELMNKAIVKQVNLIEGEFDDAIREINNTIDNIEVPTKTSELINDSGFITIKDIPEDEDFPVTSVNGQTGDVHIDIPTVPTNISSFNNDAGYITDPGVVSVNSRTGVVLVLENVLSDWNSTSGLSKILNKPILKAVATSGDYNDLDNLPSILTTDTNYAGSATTGGTANKTASIPYAQVDSTSTSTAFTATVDGITELRDGVCCLLKNGIVTSASGFTLNVNDLGAKPCYTNLAAATRDTTIFNIKYTMLFVYDSTRVDGGGWICYRGYDNNTDAVGYNIREYYNGGKKLKTAMRRYQLVMTTMDDMLLPVYSGSYTTATNKVLTTESFNPFGQIYYYGTTTTIAADGTPANMMLYVQATYNTLVDLRYSFNTGTTLTAGDDIYLVCVPQSDGSVKLHTDPIAKSLPTTEDGLVYKRLGKAYDDYRIILELDKPCYYYKDGAVRLWTNNAESISQADIASWNNKQDTLVSGTNIKTVNGQSLLGSGDITIGTAVEIPLFSASDNGKVLGVVDGKLAWVNAATS